ncbi:hypothetical protein FKR81_36410 [Lentzea tibetensis]|uniref:Uncharacterized protein n=1 Tax=Lentzea tibetensis TaxID=2591470 RepID=A0A563EIN0_9PSEU|nr:hypothetical protein [Lentzea tibetensis]TWP46226.1 hypothetical protein FKR81_36410 [Lentzea tibetensis]
MRPQSATTPTHADAPSPGTSAPHGGPNAPHTQQPGFTPPHTGSPGMGAPHTGGPAAGTPHTGGPSTHGPNSPSAHGPGGRPDTPATRPDGPGSRPDGTRPDASRPRTDAPGGHPNSPSRPDTPAPHNRPDSARSRGDSPTTHPGQRPDAPSQPHNRPDGTRPDGSRPDGSRPDGTRPDGTRPGSAHPDTPSHAPDRPGHTPDRPGHSPDGNRPDSHAPDSHGPDSPHHDPDTPGHHDKPDTDTPNSHDPNSDTPHTHADEPRPDPAEAHARHAEPTPAGVSHHGGDPDMGDLPHRVPNDPRFFTADVHITPDGRARIGGHDYTPAEYADMLRRSGYDGSKPVRLIGCDAASNDFAQQLSRHLDAPVVAPTKPAWTDANGRVFTSDVDITPDGTRQPKIPPNGEWETHHPDGSKTKASDDGYAPGSDKNTDGADAKDRGDEPKSDSDSTDAKDKPETPKNDPDWDKADPADRARIQEQVDQIRDQVRERFDQYSREAWDEVDGNWDDLKKRYDRPINEKGLPEEMFKGTETHNRFEKRVEQDMNDLIDPESGYRIRVETSWDAEGDLVPRGTKDSIRPDLILERQFRDESGRLQWETAHVWDLKTGQDVISNSWATKVNDRLDPVKTPETINHQLADQGKLPKVDSR